MKKILIDDRWSGTGGIGTFAEEVKKITQFDSASFKGKPYSPLDCIKTSITLLRRRNSVVFFPGYIPPLYSKTPYVFTIHDLNHLERKDNSSFLKRIFYKFIIKRGCSHARYVLTVSDFSRKRIIEWANIPEEKVINVGNGVSSEFTPEGVSKSFDSDYFLCVSNRKRHKNEIGTIKAFSNAKLPNDVKLVFTGNSTEELKKIISDLNIGNRVIFTGFVENDELPQLYRGATALIFVSFYEGFGLPVIEAMASGVPVITSNTTSLGEVAGDAALLVDPNNSTEISNAIADIFLDLTLRHKLIAAGLIQSKKYSWHITADKIKGVLESIK